MRILVRPLSFIFLNLVDADFGAKEGVLLKPKPKPSPGDAIDAASATMGGA
jgi:hypothetical protein